MLKRESWLVACSVGIPQSNQSVSQKAYKPLCGEVTKPIFIFCREQSVTTVPQIYYCYCDTLYVKDSLLNYGFCFKVVGYNFSIVLLPGLKLLTYK